MRKVLIVAVGIAGFAAFVGTAPAFADCRTENAACVKGVSSPFNSVACGSLYRTCAAHQAVAAQQQAKQTQSANKPALQNPAPASVNHSGRR